MKREYIKSKNELADYESLIGNTTKTLFLEDNAWNNHTKRALQNKLAFMKEYQKHFLGQTRKPVRADSMENFDELFKTLKND